MHPPLLTKTLRGTTEQSISSMPGLSNNELRARRRMSFLLIRVTAESHNLLCFFSTKWFQSQTGSGHSSNSDELHQPWPARILMDHHHGSPASAACDKELKATEVDPSVDTSNCADCLAKHLPPPTILPTPTILYSNLYSLHTRGNDTMYGFERPPIYPRFLHTFHMQPGRRFG